MNTADDKKRLPCCALPLFFIACICSVLILIGTAQSTAEKKALQLASEHSDVLQTAQSPRSTFEPQIQILDRQFTDPQLAQGESIYLQYCAACHGAEGQGQFPDAPLEPDSTGKIGAPPHNEDGHSWHHSDILLIRYVTEGGFSDPARFYTMPPFRDILSDEQIQQVIAYIKTMWTDEQRMRQRRLTEEEESLFSE